MLSIVDIKNRIKSVKDTSQITRAMEHISVSKMRKANIKYNNNQSYFYKVRSTIKDILEHSDVDIKHPYLEIREGKRTAYIVIASDKGMAGDYNQKVLKLAYSEIEKTQEKYTFTIGQMARDFFVRKGIVPDVEFLHCAQNPTLDDARRITNDIFTLYDDNQMDEVKIVYTKMINTMTHIPVVLPLLPLERKDFEDAEIESDYRAILDFDPSPEKVFDTLAPQYILGIVYSCLIQAVSCEHSERMRTMNSATNNALEIIEKLELDFNRARQEAITTEIAEVASSTILFTKDN